jgi:hypothetical protein
VSRERLPRWTPIVLFLVLWLGASVAPSSAQKPTTANQVWDQLQGRAHTLATNNGYTTWFFYMVGTLNKGGSGDWGLKLYKGRSYFIVGVCDNDCPDVDLALEDVDGFEIASDTAADDLPVIRFTPSATDDYWVVPKMHDCRAEPCAYGILVLGKG